MQAKSVYKEKMVKAPYIPSELPLQELEWQRLSCLIGNANWSLANYNGLLKSMINPQILLSPVTFQEAVLSSKIEGTVTTLGDVLRFEAGEKFEETKEIDFKEVLNYRRALMAAEREVSEKPITLHLIREIHKILLEGVRGRDKKPGEFRHDQNWIGKKGRPIEEARYVPPEPLIMNEHLEKWIKYLRFQNEDVLLQAAVVHAQFEIIHPFNDGNGRIGRILIPLFLYRKSKLFRPMFYLSEFFEENHEEYADRLLFITKSGDWQGWIEFFLTAIIEQAKQNMERAGKIHSLYEEMKTRFQNATRSQFAINALDAFFVNPIIDSTKFARNSNIKNRVTSTHILRTLKNEGLIHVLHKGIGATPTTFVFGRLINIAEGAEIFPE